MLWLYSNNTKYLTLIRSASKSSTRRRLNLVGVCHHSKLTTCSGCQLFDWLEVAGIADTTGDTVDSGRAGLGIRLPLRNLIIWIWGLTAWKIYQMLLKRLKPGGEIKRLTFSFSGFDCWTSGFVSPPLISLVTVGVWLVAVGLLLFMTGGFWISVSLIIVEGSTSLISLISFSIGMFCVVKGGKNLSDLGFLLPNSRLAAFSKSYNKLNLSYKLYEITLNILEAADDIL